MKKILGLKIISILSFLSMSAQQNDIKVSLKEISPSAYDNKESLLVIKFCNESQDTLFISNIERLACNLEINEHDDSQDVNYILLKKVDVILKEIDGFVFREHPNTLKAIPYNDSFMSRNKLLPQRLWNNKPYFIIPPSGSISINAVLTLSFYDLDRIPQLSTHQRKKITAQLGLSFKYFRSQNVTVMTGRTLLPPSKELKNVVLRYYL